MQEILDCSGCLGWYCGCCEFKIVSPAPNLFAEFLQSWDCTQLLGLPCHHLRPFCSVPRLSSSSDVHSFAFRPMSKSDNAFSPAPSPQMSNSLPISCVLTFLQPLLATLECVCHWNSVPLRGCLVHNSRVSPVALCGRFVYRSCLATCCHWLALSVFPGFSKCASK